MYVTLVNKLSNREGWSMCEMNQAIEVSLKIQSRKDNLNPFTCISLSCPQGMIYDDHFMPHQIYALPSNDFDQIDLPISSRGRFYVKFSPLHP